MVIADGKPATRRYRDLKQYWQDLFHCRVYKLSVDAGFTCPNRDGTAGIGGCIYCDGRGSRWRAQCPLPSVTEQIRAGQAFYRKVRKASKFIVYFQTFTNTYAPVDRLQTLYSEALLPEDVVGLSIGTRPDCLSPPVVDLLCEYARKTHLWLELGLQSFHDRTLRSINRGHDAASFFNAVERLAGRGIHLCVHIICGLPGETREDILETARRLAALPIQGIKIHQLLALRGTALGNAYEDGAVALLARETYVQLVCDILECLPPEMVIQRLTADGYQDILLGPDWTAAKLQIRNDIDREMARRDTYQGRLYPCQRNGRGVEAALGTQYV